MSAERRWIVYVCAEPDGENCQSGTHRHICRHECAAVRRFHESKGREPGPQVVGIEVMPVAEHEADRVRLEAARTPEARKG